MILVSWPPEPPPPPRRRYRFGPPEPPPRTAPGRKPWRHQRRRRWFLFHTYLPYGRWDCADGRSVLFNRDYEPIYQRRPGEPTITADPAEWVDYQGRAEYFFKDGNPPWNSVVTLRRCLQVLRNFGAGWQPIAHYAEVQRGAPSSTRVEDAQ